MISIELPPGSNSCAVEPETRSARGMISARAIA